MFPFHRIIGFLFVVAVVVLTFLFVPASPPVVKNYNHISGGFLMRHCVDPGSVPKDTKSWNKFYRSKLFQYNAFVAYHLMRTFKQPKLRKVHHFFVVTADDLRNAFSLFSEKVERGIYNSSFPFDTFELRLRKDGAYSVIPLGKKLAQCVLNPDWQPVHLAQVI